MSKLAEASRFLAVGGGATVVHVAVALAVHGILGVPPLWSNFLAFLVAMTVSYAGNRSWTFNAATRHGFAIPRFLAVSLGAFAINHALVYVIAVRMQSPMWVAMAAVLAVVPALSFWLQKTRVFQPNRADA